MSKILVTGGSGFLGRHLIESLLEAGYHVRSLDLSLPAIQHEKLEFIEGSFLDRKLLEEAIIDCDIVFHLASTTLPKTSNDDPIFDINTNLIGTVALLDIARKINVRKFIFISSGGTVYGVPTKLPVSEEHSTYPTCSYGVVKLAIEKYLYMYHKIYGLDTCTLRLSNPYGEHQRVDAAQGAVTVFCHKAVMGDTIEIWGDGSIVRDFIYVKDAVRAMLCAITANCAGMVINVGQGVGVSLNQVINIIESTIGHKIDKQYLTARSFDVPEIYLDIRHAKDILEWSTQTTIEDGVNILIKYLRTLY